MAKGVAWAEGRARIDKLYKRFDIEHKSDNFKELPGSEARVAKDRLEESEKQIDKDVRFKKIGLPTPIGTSSTIPGSLRKWLPC